MILKYRDNEEVDTNDVKRFYFKHKYPEKNIYRLKAELKNGEDVLILKAVQDHWSVGYGEGYTYADITNKAMEMIQSAIESGVDTYEINLNKVLISLGWADKWDNIEENEYSECMSRYHGKGDALEWSNTTKASLIIAGSIMGAIVAYLI